MVNLILTLLHQTILRLGHHVLINSQIAKKNRIKTLGEFGLAIGNLIVIRDALK